MTRLKCVNIKKKRNNEFSDGFVSHTDWDCGWWWTIRPTKQFQVLNKLFLIKKPKNRHSFGEQFSAKKWAREAAGQRDIMAAYGGVRLEDIRGLRAPFLSVKSKLNNAIKWLV